jgi:D-alanyl-lipoteichoic acid acyltransferase DltB (MBOAT superfamily)
MLFNSVEFIFIFLPIALGLFIFFERRESRSVAIFVLIASSIIFYVSWNFAYIIILLSSVVGNYLVGYFIQSSPGNLSRKLILIAAISINLVLLFYFKYFVYFLSAFGVTFNGGANSFFSQWALPLGISFWTFQQINFLLERYNRRKDGLEFLDYITVVLFFPHLIAGPIVRTAELGPQIREIGLRNRNVTEDISIGLFIFIVGLFKKVVIADAISVFPQELYQATSDGSLTHLGFVFSWFSIMVYILQLYFDFSGYCDMGMGLARMFGFVFPINFNSPLKAKSFVDFWRNWHMTLTRFFTETLHAPLAMALMRRMSACKISFINTLTVVGAPVLFTFFITGIWHGAGNQFVVFGILNGLLMAGGVIISQFKIIKTPAYISRIVTLSLVSIVFIFFRAPTLSAALDVAGQLIKFPTIEDVEIFYTIIGKNNIAFVMCFIALGIALFAPNLYELLREFHKPMGFKSNGVVKFTIRKFNILLSSITAIVFFACIYMLQKGGAVEFIYFQF